MLAPHYFGARLCIYRAAPIPADARTWSTRPLASGMSHAPGPRSRKSSISSSSCSSSSSSSSSSSFGTWRAPPLLCQMHSGHAAGIVLVLVVAVAAVGVVVVVVQFRDDKAFVPGEKSLSKASGETHTAASKTQLRMNKSTLWEVLCGTLRPCRGAFRARGASSGSTLDWTLPSLAKVVLTAQKQTKTPTRQVQKPSSH